MDLDYLPEGENVNRTTVTDTDERAICFVEGPHLCPVLLSLIVNNKRQS